MSEYFWRMLKNSFSKAAASAGPEEIPTALREGRSPISLVLANGKTPPVLPISGKLLLSDESLNDARTTLAGFFSILLPSLLGQQTYIGHHILHFSVRQLAAP